MGGRRIDPKVRKDFWDLVQQGWSIKAAAEKVGVSEPTAYNWTRDVSRVQGKNWKEQRLENSLPPPKKRVQGEAFYCLSNFAEWRKRYLGRTSTPWQVEAANRCVEWIESGETEFAVINCPPGSGKSTLFTHDIPCWLICKDRTIRIMIGSANLRLASKYSGRIRRTLERVRPLPDCPASLAMEYGRFRPEQPDLWRRDEFIVLPYDDEPIEDKEPTVSSFGMETEFLGTRANFIVWDDLVTNKTMATDERIEKLQVWWDTEGETRVEPGGCLLLQGQRMGARDLYRYALDQQVFDDEDDEAKEPTGTRYRHIIYPAHFEDRCHGDHGKEAVAFPGGCLLDPIRLPWRGTQGLSTKSISKEAVYRVQYQQEDVDPANVLVEKVWIDGGKGADGVIHNGCWDTDRAICELPLGLQPPLFSIATADPSPTKYWSIQWWIYQPATGLRFLMDMVRSSLDSPDFLDYLTTSGKYVGIVNDWQERSIALGLPISYWIVEDNAAQRFMLQYDFITKWANKHRVKIVAHSTYGNKLDPDYGIQMLKNVYYHGLCRFPGKDILARSMVKPLYKEVTTYPEPGTDDCLMAQWFLEYNLNSLTKPPVVRQKLERPSWLGRLSA